MSTGKGKVVCVTGASGFIASWLVKCLLERGYTVRATVRDPSDSKKTAHLCALDGAKERLHLFKADVLEKGSFDAAVQGCDGVFHTASPCYLEAKDPQAELIDPAVKGTLNVLASCKKFSIKRVVFTSSIASLIFSGAPKTPDVIVDETWYSSPEVCEKEKRWYILAKTLAEEAAWKFTKENNLDMVSINPGFTLGPLLQPTLNFSSSLIAKMIGAPVFFNASMPWVNVQDVAKAHIIAFELPSASGRYLLVDRVIHHSDLVNIIHELYPALKLPEKCMDNNPFVPTYQASKERAKSLGINFIPLETTLKETIESLKEKNFISF